MSRHPGIHQKIRGTLRELPEGENVPDLAKLLGHRDEAVRKALNAMPDAYIDRWDDTGPQLRSVWMVVVPPAHCPRPDKKSVRG